MDKQHNTSSNRLRCTNEAGRRRGRKWTLCPNSLSRTSSFLPQPRTPLRYRFDIDLLFPLRLLALSLTISALLSSLLLSSPLLSPFSSLISDLSFPAPIVRQLHVPTIMHHACPPTPIPTPLARLSASLNSHLSTSDTHHLISSHLILVPLLMSMDAGAGFIPSPIILYLYLTPY